MRTMRMSAPKTNFSKVAVKWDYDTFVVNQILGFLHKRLC